MAIYENRLSSTPVVGTYDEAKRQRVTMLKDYELGGIAVGDTSQGLQYQVWEARLSGNDILLSAPSVNEFVWLSGTGISEISFTFDQNMNPTVAFVQQGVSKLNWFDPLISGFTTTEFSGVTSPRLSLDDKRPEFATESDIIFAYLRDGSLYYRQQRDRYQIEYFLTTTNARRIIKFGMTDKHRLQFTLR